VRDVHREVKIVDASVRPDTKPLASDRVLELGWPGQGAPFRNERAGSIEECYKMVGMPGCLHGLLPLSP